MANYGGETQFSSAGSIIHAPVVSSFIAEIWTTRRIAALLFAGAALACLRSQELVSRTFFEAVTSHSSSHALPEFYAPATANQRSSKLYLSVLPTHRKQQSSQPWLLLFPTPQYRSSSPRTQAP
jgi:hypothetical protein